jgi:hypothetical protein
MLFINMRCYRIVILKPIEMLSMENRLIDRLMELMRSFAENIRCRSKIIGFWSVVLISNKMEKFITMENKVYKRVLRGFSSPIFLDVRLLLQILTAIVDRVGSIAEHVMWL